MRTAIATVSRMGNSRAVAIPKPMSGPGLALGDKVLLEYDGSSIRLTPLGPLPTLHSLMRGYDGPRPEPVDLDGLPAGRELW